MELENLPDNSEKDARAKAILEHPLENEQDWREVAKLIDEDAAQELALDE